MDYLLSLSDGPQNHMVVFSLPEKLVRQNAIDVVLDVIGSDDIDHLVEENYIAEGYADDLRALQQFIFDRDDQGIFIREPIYFVANAKDLNPDAPILQAFVEAERNGVTYYRCDMTAIQIPSNPANQPDKVKEFSLIFFLHQIAIGRQLDVTKEYPELNQVLARAEKEELVEIDVKTASYRLTEKGKRQHDSYLKEAQDLIKRYDIYGDVDVDSSGQARFDTGLGKDLRVPIFEFEGVDPFRARFILGLNDAEWDQVDNWTDLVQDPKWYTGLMEPIERAPAIDEIGRNKLQSIIEQGKAVLRQ